MISSNMIRGYTDLMILALLVEEPSYGYQLSKQIKAKSPVEYEMKETTLYSAINRLDKNGYVSSFKRTAESGKVRTYYKITEDGLAYFEDKCQEWRETVLLINQFVKGDNHECDL